MPLSSNPNVPICGASLSASADCGVGIICSLDCPAHAARMEVDRISVIIFVTAGLDRKHIVLKCLKRSKHKVNLLICSTRADITDEQSRDDGLIKERYADDLTGEVQPGRTLAALDHCCVGHCGPGAWPIARTPGKCPSFRYSDSQVDRLYSSCAYAGAARLALGP